MGCGKRFQLAQFWLETVCPEAAAPARNALRCGPDAAERVADAFVKGRRELRRATKAPCMHSGNCPSRRRLFHMLGTTRGPRTYVGAPLQEPVTVGTFERGPAPKTRIPNAVYVVKIVDKSDGAGEALSQRSQPRAVARLPPRLRLPATACWCRYEVPGCPGVRMVSRYQ